MYSREVHLTDDLLCPLPPCADESSIRQAESWMKQAREANIVSENELDTRLPPALCHDQLHHHLSLHGLVYIRGRV